MHPTLRHHDLHANPDMTQAQENALLASARALQRAAAAGQAQPLLKGKNIGLLCEDADTAEAMLFERAATELGAKVARIRASDSGVTSPQLAPFTVRMLGKLYDAVECQGMTPDLVRRLGDAIGVPVYAGLATAQHPTARLATQLGGDASVADNRRFVLQAVLLGTVAG
jgi:ornithine carbamoyltransferase